MTHSLPALRIDVMSSQPPSRLRDPARLSPEEAALLELEERRGLPVHVGSVLIFEGSAPTLAELAEHVAARLDRVPRYRRRIVEVPLRAGRPVWAEDPHLHLAHHLRHEALPGPADEAALARLASRVFSQPIDRGKPLWELCLVEGLHGGRFALLSKSHAALVDGAANPDIATALLDESAAPPPPPGRAPDGVAGPLPSRGQLLATALAERASDPRETLRTLERAASRVREELEARNLEPLARIGAPPPTLLNGPVGPHRRFAFADAELAALRRAKDRLGGTVNDIVLAAVAGAVGRALREQGEHTDGLVLRALIPVADARRPSSARLISMCRRRASPIPTGSGA